MSGSRSPNASTESEIAVSRLRQDILSGALPPDSKLKIRDLKALYGIGASPMREALAQLAASGFVELHAQKGFRVPPITADELIDITESRKIIEAEALRLAIENADAAWEDEIVASYHLFEREIMRFYEIGDKRLDVYEERHHRFHRALIAACPYKMLKAYCDDLYVRKTRYRRLTRSYGFNKDSVVSEHRMLMDVILDRDVDRAVPAITAHIGLTADIVDKVAQFQCEASQETGTKFRL